MKIKFYFFPNKNFNIFPIKTSIYYYNLLKKPRLLFITGASNQPERGSFLGLQRLRKKARSS